MRSMGLDGQAMPPARAEPQGQRRVHRSALPPASSGSAPPCQRAGLVGQFAARTIADRKGAVGRKSDPHGRFSERPRPARSYECRKRRRMNALFNTQPPVALSQMPIELEALMPRPLLLPGENLEHYQLTRQTIIAEIAPKTAVEWLLSFDVVELSWDIQRYRALRHRVLESYRQQAIEQALGRIDLVGIPSEVREHADRRTRLNALSWRADPIAAAEIETRLAAYGFDQDAINVEVYAQARELFLMFETLLVSAQSRRMMLLRDIANQRHAKACRKVQRF